MNTKTKQKRTGKPVQIYLEEGLRMDFQRLIQEYDPMLPFTTAIRKLIVHATQDHWLPGYIRKEKTMSNTLANISAASPQTSRKRLDNKILG